MKKHLLVALALLVVLAGAFAQEEKSPVSFQYGSGIYYNEIINENPPDDIFANLGAILSNFRAEAFAGLGVRLADVVVVGVEGDAAAMSWSTTDTNGTTVSDAWFDLAALATLRLDLGGTTGITALGGVMLNGYLGTALQTSYSYIVGGRAALGGLYGEFDYVIPMADGAKPYNRYGFGFAVGN